MEVWLSKRKTRKKHTCWGCASTIPIGTIAEHCRCVDAGEWSESYWCTVCRKVIDNMDYSDRQDGFNFGDVKDHWNEEWLIAAQELSESPVTSANSSSMQAANSAASTH